MAQTRTNGSVEQSSADLAAQIANLKSDVAELTNTLAGYGRARTAQIEASAEDTFAAAKKKGTEMAQRSSQQARETYAGIEKAVSDNPAVSVGVAAGLGFLAGLLTARR